MGFQTAMGLGCCIRSVVLRLLIVTVVGTVCMLCMVIVVAAGRFGSLQCYLEASFALNIHSRSP